jgi:hypothetical protein
MSRAQRRYLLLEQGVGSAVFNFFVNAGIAWAMFHAQPSVPLWGQQSIMGDTIGTCFILPFLTCLIGTRLVRGHLRSGKVTPLTRAQVAEPPLAWLPPGTGRRGATLGVACVAVLAPLALVTLLLLDVGSLPLWHFVFFKAGFAAFAAALVTPIVALYAIAHPAPAAGTS